MSDKNATNNQIDWTNLWSELKSIQAPWEVKGLKKFGKNFGLALFFLFCSSYELVTDSVLAKTFLSGADYTRDSVKNRQGNTSYLVSHLE